MNNHINAFLNFNKSLSFLDVKITQDNGSFTTSIFHKPTFTGLYTNFDSFIPYTYKKGLVTSLLNHYFNIYSTYITFYSELDNFKKLFSLNGYPHNLLDQCIHRFLDNKFSPVPKVSLAPKKIMYFCLLFTVQHSLRICTQICKLNSNAFPRVSVHFVFHPLFCLPHFSFNNRIPNGLKSYVVCLFKCRCCNASYVGHTS